MPRKQTEEKAGRNGYNLNSRSTNASQIIVHNFNQITNHFPNDPTYGPPPLNKTFIQRYVVNDTFYQRGGPVFLLDSGETNVTGGILNTITTGVIAELAQATGGISLVIEHRYYGTSFPVPNFTTDNLRWLTSDQIIADFAYFAQNAVIPGHEDDDMTAPGRPWIVYGGSLAGGEAAFTVKTYGDIFFGGISSSGTVFAQVGYPQWVDHVIALNNTVAITKLKSIFGLEELQDIRDFGIAIAFPIGNPFLYPSPSWQEQNWDPAIGSSDFFYFCGNLTNPNAPPAVTAIDEELSKYTNGQKWTHLGNYAEYIKTRIVPLCPKGMSLDSNTCFGTHAKPKRLGKHTGFLRKQGFLYQTCTEFGQYSQAAPPGRRSLLSRSVQTDYTQRWCGWAFPPGEFNTIPPTPDVQRWNKFGGLRIQADRLAQVDGGQDPWEYACVHSPEGPGRQNSLLRPYYLIGPGGHQWDENGLLDISKEPDYIQAVHYYEIKLVKSWLADFDEWSKNRKKRADL